MQPRRVRNSSRWATPALVAMLIATPAVAQQVDTKGEDEVTALGQDIDRAGASADAGPVTDKIVDQRQRTQFRFDKSDEPRGLRAQDIQNLRQKRR